MHRRGVREVLPVRELIPVPRGAFGLASILEYFGSQAKKQAHGASVPIEFEIVDNNNFVCL